jgi:hypothetical protein
MFMPKKPVSVTIEEDNLLWLRGRAASAKRRSLSEALDDVVTAARLGGQPGEVRSVVGTVDIGTDDLGLDRADAALHTLFEASVSRPFLVKETRRG